MWDGDLVGAFLAVRTSIKDVCYQHEWTDYDHVQTTSLLEPGMGMRDGWWSRWRSVRAWEGEYNGTPISVVLIDAHVHLGVDRILSKISVSKKYVEQIK